MNRRCVAQVAAAGFALLGLGGCYSSAVETADAGSSSTAASSSASATASSGAVGASGTATSASGVGTSSSGIGIASSATSSGTTSASSSSTAVGTTAGATTSSGTSTGGSTSGQCSQTEYNTLNGCTWDSDCACGQWCVDDPFVAFHSQKICETTCTSNSDCPNAASVCTSLATPADSMDVGKTCTVNVCQEAGTVAGSPCVPGAGGAGTCIPLDLNFGTFICMPNGTATSCVEATTNDDPFLYGNAMGGTGYIAEPQPNNAALFCAAGAGCYAPQGVGGESGSCEPLCSYDGGPGCTAPAVCARQDPHDSSWGFCLPCGASDSDGGSPSLCIVDGDCCEHHCGGGAGDIGLCLPAVADAGGNGG